ncbi:MAG TPA: radical SAM protein [Pyrinomonadaceae bacterium]
MSRKAASLAEILDEMTAEAAPELTEHLAGTQDLRCYACGHRCLIREGKRGICKVRYNERGRLLVPKGYVAALACDPTEKKPFFHALPGSDTLTFGMLGCDLHCAYCFTGDTLVTTHRGPISLEELFRSAPRVEQHPDAEIAFHDDLSAVAASGELRKVRGIFKHSYRGRLAIVKPFYLPELRCTPDHRVYATDDPAAPPAPIHAERLTENHYLAIPRHYAFSSTQIADLMKELCASRKVIETEDYCLVPLRSIKFNDYEGDVYNMEVEEEHNYLAGFFLVSNCQNWLTSQTLRDDAAGVEPRVVSAERLVTMARACGASMVGTSYNEPLITAEWAIDVFRKAKPAGFKTAFISNGNATPQVLDYIRPWTDCYKIDLKSMSDRNYRQLGGVVDNILDTVRMVKERGFWTEIVTLVIPGFNDSEDELRRAADFIASVSPDIPWHVTAFHKDYNMTENENTTAEQLIRACEIGREAGLRYVYAGNLPGRVGRWEHTFCHSCEELLVERYGYIIRQMKVTPEGRCPKCSASIPGVWS